jgi:hypothetical protein
MAILPAILPAMTKAQAKALRTHRQRLANRGIVRIEVRVPKEDAATIRRLAYALLDEETRESSRAWLLANLASTGGLKALLLSGALADLPIPKRSRDRGRPVKL